MRETDMNRGEEKDMDMGEKDNDMGEKDSDKG